MNKAPTEKTLTTTQMASLLEITPRRLQQLAVEGIVPKVKRGRFQIEPTVKAYVGYLKALLNGDHNRQDLAVQKARQASASADRQEFDLAKEKNVYLPIDLVEEILVRMSGVAAGQLDTFASSIRVKYGLTSTQVRSITEELIRTRNLISKVRFADLRINSAPDHL